MVLEVSQSHIKHCPRLNETFNEWIPLKKVFSEGLGIINIWENKLLLRSHMQM